jgi:hypothetical protein
MGVSCLRIESIIAMGLSYLAGSFGWPEVRPHFKVAAGRSCPPLRNYFK